MKQTQFFWPFIDFFPFDFTSFSQLITFLAEGHLSCKGVDGKNKKPSFFYSIKEE